jgi:hypothetical protein
VKMMLLPSARTYFCAVVPSLTWPLPV